MPGPIDLPLDALEVVTGGASQRLFTDAGAGVRPDHHYGLASDTFSVTAGGGRTQFEVVNDLIQRFNAPTGDALYRAGNDPGADFGVVSRPGAQYVEGTRDSVGVPLDWGGNVTLMHGDGFARNTTIDGAHPLTGTITRNAVVDLNEGGGFQVLTLGRGEGLHNQPADSLPGKIATALETPYANLSHLANPELGYQAFSRLDAALIASSQGQASPNLAERGGMFSEGWGALTALGNGIMTAAGFNQPSPTGTPQQQLVYDVARELNQTGPVDGFFVQSSVLPGVYHVGPEGSTYYERGADGRPQVTQVDEFAGVDQAVARQAALAESSPPPAPAQEVQVPMPPEVGPPQLDPASAPGDGGPRIDNQAAPTMPGDGGGDRGGAGGGGEVVNDWNGADGRGGGGAGWGGGGSAGDGGGSDRGGDGGGSDRGGEGGDWSGGGGGDWGGGGGDWGGGGE